MIPAYNGAGYNTQLHIILQVQQRGCLRVYPPTDKNTKIKKKLTKKKKKTEYFPSVKVTDQVN